MAQKLDKDIRLIIIDLFSGAGGVSTGFENHPSCKVIAAINHDEMAIASHSANHPDTLHFVEDIRHITMLTLQRVLMDAKAQYPNALVVLWASLECTNFSKAKGGLPRDADSRSLADFMPWYVESLQPDYVGIENVIEFMSWGPLGEDGKPQSKKEGCDYMRWVNWMQSLNNGYNYDWRELNSADFGAYTSRKRFFAWFAHNGLPIQWPLPTHSKAIKASNEIDLFGSTLKPWKPVKEVLQLEKKGESIFARKKPLSEKTLERIYAGLIKFVAGGKEAFLVKYNSMNQSGKYVAPDMENPSPVVSTQGRLGVVHTEFLSKYFSGKPEHKNLSVDGPAHTIKPIDSHALVQTEFMAAYYGNGDNVRSINQPASTLRTKDTISLVQPCFIYRDFGSVTNSDVDSPAGSITASPKLNLVSCDPFIMDTAYNNGPKQIEKPLPTITANRKWHYLVNPQWFNQVPGSIEQPAPTLIARMDKAPPYLVTTESGQFAIECYETDSVMTLKIKEFMALYGISEIKMRMLFIDELKKVQGFPDNYILLGNQAQQKKYIGNSVVPIVVTKMAEALISANSIKWQSVA